jgi:5-methylcytosine-specific restriction endonuclease McrA
MVYDDARETADTSLEKLAAELAARGFQTRLTAPHRPGGATTAENLQLLCGECNRAKGADL